MLKWSYQSVKDLKSILEYIAKDDIEASNKMAMIFYSNIENIGKFPKIGMKGRVKNTREFFIPKYPYVIVYLEDNCNIVILRILHAHRKYPV